MFAISVRLLSVIAGGVALVGCTGANDGAVTPTGGTSSVGGGSGAGGAGSPATGGTGGAVGGAGGTAGSSGGTTGGVGGAAAGTGGSAAGTGGSTAGAGTGGATAGTGGGTAGAGGATAGAGGSAAAGGGAGGNAGAGGSGGAGGGAGAAGSAGAGNLPNFSFFVASMAGLQRLAGSPDGFGGDFTYGEADGLSGADKICTELAESSMAGSAAKQWRAFLSVTAGPGGGPVNAIDRIGDGPWYDRLGRVVAMSIDALQNVRPMGADPLIINDLPNEFGVPNSDPNGTGGVDNHHVITGSNAMGELDSDNLGDTCNDWTSAVGTTGQPQCGFSWPRGGGGGGGNGTNWITGFRAHGCAPGVSIIQDGGGDSDILTVGEGGGYGAIYCFALTP
jgi:hypothetical protein